MVPGKFRVSDLQTWRTKERRVLSSRCRALCPEGRGLVHYLHLKTEPKPSRTEEGYSKGRAWAACNVGSTTWATWGLRLLQEMWNKLQALSRPQKPTWPRERGQTIAPGSEQPPYLKLRFQNATSRTPDCASHAQPYQRTRLQGRFLQRVAHHLWCLQCRLRTVGSSRL